SDELPETFDELDLPEYSEEEALADMPISSDTPGDVIEQGSDDPEVFDEADLPEYSEEEALADMPIEPEASELPGLAESPNIPTDMAPDEAGEISEQDALFDIFQAQNLDSLSKDGFDESALSELLSEDEDELMSSSFSFDSALDAKTTDSAGMDIAAMLEVGGEDWNGFNLSAEQQASISTDIPDDEQAIWSEENKPEQAVVSDENWEHQEDFDSKAEQYRTIDELMAEVESEEANQANPDDEELNLNVGLDEFPDVIGDIGFEDVDSNAEAVGKMDLAKIYMEMNDTDGAIKLLEEAIVDGSDTIRREAKSLIDAIRRG
ncbi:FimV/HubP family polar landmark protein, partial [Vibrio genomosp. F10]|uniref:FimV/HubP family polar landmark protein n=2 Tax=Vibrio genomosp. F10 TaxID=723171 RepID=UPI0003642E63